MRKPSVRAAETGEAADSLAGIAAREVGRPLLGSAAGVELLDDLTAHGFTRDELFDLVVPRRTLARRRQAGQALSPEEADRAVRLARIGALAERVFGRAEKAHRWLRKPSRTLDGAVPLDLLRSETGAVLVEQTLHRIDYGMLA
jgi:putative toxin-antitoxin system antitoxin component (TIGR02293 family)